MNDLVLANRPSDWRRLKALVLDSVSSPITKRVYNLGLDEFIEWYGQELRPGFTKATVNAWRGALEARKLGSVSINVRITAVRKLAVEACGQRAVGAGVGGWHHSLIAQCLPFNSDCSLVNLSVVTVIHRSLP
jgi:hypothetical protein